MLESSDRVDKIKEETLEILKRNRRVKDGFQYTIPAPVSYPYQWFWDSCFHAIILSHFNVEDAKKEILSVVSHQFDNGMIPHIIYWDKAGVIGNIPRDIKWGKGNTSSITQPPLIADAVWKIYQKDGDKKFLEEIYPNLYHFFNYLLTERDPRHNNLAGIINPDESGEDNSPRFDSSMNLLPQHTERENMNKRLELVSELQSCNFDAPFCMKKFFWVKDVPFNSILIKGLQTLSKISEELDYKEEALNFKEHSLKISKAMRDRMFEDGIFWSTRGEDYEKIKVKTWAIFAPLYAGILSQEEARELVLYHLFNKREFDFRFGISTVSKEEKSFVPSYFWRGPVWMNVHWFIYKGLLNYGMKDEAKEILDRSLYLLGKSGFREYFNPETGEGLGSMDFTWGGLVVDMLES